MSHISKYLREEQSPVHLLVIQLHHIPYTKKSIVPSEDGVLFMSPSSARFTSQI